MGQRKRSPFSWFLHEGEGEEDEERVQASFWKLYACNIIVHDAWLNA